MVLTGSFALLALLPQVVPQQGGAAPGIGQPFAASITAATPAITVPRQARRFGDGEIRQVVFDVPIASTADYAIELRSPDFDAWLVARRAGDRAVEAIGSRDRPATIVVTAGAGVVLRIEVHAVRGGVGDFTLVCAPATSRARARAGIARQCTRLDQLERQQGNKGLAVAYARSQLGMALLDQGEYSAAATLCRAALEAIPERDGVKDFGLLTCLNNLGLVLETAGRHAEAEPLFRRTVAQFESLAPTDPAFATALSNLAMTLDSQRRYREAEAIYRRALAIQEQTLDANHTDLARTLANLAALHTAEFDFERAEPLHRRVVAICEADGEDPLRLATALNNFAVMLCRRGTLDEAEQLYRRALAIREQRLPPDHPATALTLTNLGALLLDRGDHAAAEDPLRRALAAFEAIDPDHPDALATRSHLALLCARRGRTDEAWQLCEALCRSGVARLVRELGYTPAEARFTISASHASRLNQLLSHAVDAHDRDRIDAAWTHIAEWKGVVYRLARRLAARPHEPDRVRELRDRLRHLSADVSRLAYARDVAGLAQQREQFDEAVLDRTQVQAELLRELALPPAIETVDPATFASQLPANSALLDFVVHRPLRLAPSDPGANAERWGEPRFVCFVVRAGNTHASLVDLGPVATLRDLVERWLAALAAATPSADVEAALAAAVRLTLWDPLVASLDGADLVFCSAEDVLAQVPFAAIEVAPGERAIERARFVAVQDAISLRQALAGRAPPIASPSLLAVGAVDYRRRAAAPAPSAPHALLRGGVARDWTPLPGTGAEIDTVCRLFDGLRAHDAAVVLRGADGTEEAFAQLVAGRTFLHLATHAFFERRGVESLWAAALGNAGDRAAERPAAGNAGDAVALVPPGLLAGIVLAGANETPPEGRADGILTADEVVDLGLANCRLAVLSACETALGTYRSGEGLSSLRRAFAEAGARSVVCTLWQVRDDGSRALVERFYRELWQNGLPVVDALRAAQLAMRHERQPVGSWAAWQVAGDWR